MNLLILGGTRFVGRHIAEAGITAKHQISILTRGKSPDELPTEIKRLQGDRDQGRAGLNALADQTWDACIDTSGYIPRQVIDARDLAKFTLKSIEDKIFGIFDMAGPRLSWQTFLNFLEAKKIVWADTTFISEHQLGFEELPLYIPKNTLLASLMNISAQKALTAGLSHTNPAMTARDTHAWSQYQTPSYALSTEREKALLKQLATQ